MPYFSRTRRLDIRRLETKPQESLEIVHAILIAAVKEVQENCRKLERSFYGTGKNVTNEIAKWSGSLKQVMKAASQPTIYHAKQLDDLIKHTIDPSKTFTVDTYDLNRSKECYRKIQDTMPDKFEGLILDLKTISKYLEKYCLSFHSLDIESDIFLDTAHNYEVQRQGYMDVIKESVSKIHSLPQKFKTTGLCPTDLSTYGLEIGRKCECLFAPFLVMFPEAIECVNAACAAMFSWIDADGNYSQFLENDVKDLEERKIYMQHKAREKHEAYHKLLFRLNHLKKDCENLLVELERLQERENELTFEEETLVSDTNDMQIQIERKEYRRDELLKNASNMHPQVLYEKYSEVCEELRDLKLRLPFAKRELAAAVYKLNWIREKRDFLRIEEKKLHEMEKELDSLDQAKQEHDIETEATEELLKKAREIHLYKSCPDAVEKIFNERPIEVNKSRLPGNRGKNDPFEQACSTVAQAIDTDWPRFYRALPFHPARGQNTIDDDVREFSHLAASVGTLHIAKRCLYRWRRFHTRAKLDDLLEALQAIHRDDILHAVDSKLNPPKPKTPNPDVYPDFLEEYLIPFWKEGEKFDKLRAANKI